MTARPDASLRFPMFGPLFRSSFLGAALVAASLTACNGCRPSVFGSGAVPTEPTLRLYILSDVAGALDPCGCTKDQLGGIDHLAAFLADERSHAPASALVTAGPLFFMEPVPDAEKLEQDRAKAVTLASAFKSMGLVAFAPGENDWGEGADVFRELTAATGAAALGEGTGASWVLRTIGGVKIGFIGVSAPPSSVGAPNEPPRGQVRAAADAAKAAGAQLLIAIVAAGRGEAKRIADVVPELAAVVVGARKSKGDGNTDTPPTERIGDVLIIETANHVQSVTALDLFVRDGVYRFADGVGLEREQKRRDLARRIDELHVRISNWERDGKVAKKDLDERRADLAKLERDRSALDIAPPPTHQSFFRLLQKPIRKSLGTEPTVAEAFRQFHRAVNEQNRVAFKDRMPRAAEPGQATFMGVEACTTCHAAARAFWDKTKHAHAYGTLADDFRQFDLDCVGCHVTGYEKPGGSTVTHVEKFESVQCEACHGPGSKHAANTADPDAIDGHPTGDVCQRCHHPPHVEGFDPKAKSSEVIGPGHGR